MRRTPISGNIIWDVTFQCTYNQNPFFLQQHRLMGSSAQSSSGMLWCRLRIRLNEVPEKIPKVPGGFGAEPGQVQQGSGEGSGEGQGFGEYTGGSGEGLGGFGARARPGSTGWRRFRRRSGCKARSSSAGFPRRFRRRFCRARSGLTVFRRRFRGRSGRLWCRATSGSTGFAKDPGSLGAKPRRIQPVPDKVPEKVPRFREALVLSQVKFNRIPEKVPVRSSGRCVVQS